MWNLKSGDSPSFCIAKYVLMKKTEEEFPSKSNTSNSLCLKDDNDKFKGRSFYTYFEVFSIKSVTFRHMTQSCLWRDHNSNLLFSKENFEIRILLSFSKLINDWEVHHHCSDTNSKEYVKLYKLWKRECRLRMPLKKSSVKRDTDNHNNLLRFISRNFSHVFDML